MSQRSYVQYRCGHSKSAIRLISQLYDTDNIPTVINFQAFSAFSTNSVERAPPSPLYARGQKQAQVPYTIDGFSRDVPWSTSTHNRAYHAMSGTPGAIVVTRIFGMPTSIPPSPLTTPHSSPAAADDVD